MPTFITYASYSHSGAKGLVEILPIARPLLRRWSKKVAVSS